MGLDPGTLFRWRHWTNMYRDPSIEFEEAHLEAPNRPSYKVKLNQLRFSQIYTKCHLFYPFF